MYIDRQLALENPARPHYGGPLVVVTPSLDSLLATHSHRKVHITAKHTYYALAATPPC